MLGKNELELVLARRAKVRIAHAAFAGIVGPAIPGARLHAPQEIRGPPYRAAAAIVVRVVGDVELAVGRERETERIAEAPRDERDGSAIGRDFHDGTAARHGAFHDGARDVAK